MEVRKKEESRMILWVLIWATAYRENTIRGIDFGYSDRFHFGHAEFEASLPHE